MSPFGSRWSIREPAAPGPLRTSIFSDFGFSTSSATSEEEDAEGVLLLGFGATTFLFGFSVRTTGFPLRMDDVDAPPPDPAPPPEPVLFVATAAVSTTGFRGSSLMMLDLEAVLQPLAPAWLWFMFSVLEIFWWE